MLDRGVRFTVFDPDPEALRRIVTKGATAGKNPRTLGAASEVVLLCLPHPDVLREVALGRQGLVRGMADGAIVVDMSTSGPDADEPRFRCCHTLVRRTAEGVPPCGPDTMFRACRNEECESKTRLP